MTYEIILLIYGNFEIKNFNIFNYILFLKYFVSKYIPSNKYLSLNFNTRSLFNNNKNISIMNLNEKFQYIRFAVYFYLIFCSCLKKYYNKKVG